MGILASLGRLGSQLSGMLHTRLELAALELEEEGQRLLGFLLLGLMAVFLFGIATVLVTLAVALLFWDSYRLEVLTLLALMYAAAGVIVTLKLRKGLKDKPRLLGSTLSELRQDLNFMRAAGGDDGQ
jgi:uncharacterized membrane protein YqjE